MPFSLTSKTALVTGGGRGIGRAIALQLAATGASVMINDLDATPAAETDALIKNSGGIAATFAGDITDPNFPAKLVEAALATYGSIDIIVNNAGYTWDNVIQKTSDEQFQAMLDIHLKAPFRILRAASTWIRETAKREKAEGRQVIRKVVNISSISGTEGNAGQAGYAAGKSGIIGFTKTMAKEWGRYNVTVNAVAFGMIETRLTQVLSGEAASIDIHGTRIGVGVQPAAIDWVKAACPLGRMGTPEEAAGAVLFFCSPLSNYVTGEILHCSGGLHS